MAQQQTHVVVGIDGSEVALVAARWALDEVINRDIPLRLVHVVDAGDSPTARDGDFSAQIQLGETALNAAEAGLRASGKPVKVETLILRGDIGSTLTEQSHGAAMICVGSVGIGRLAPPPLGSTAVGLATHAHCPVAIVRSNSGEPPSHFEWIAVLVDNHLINDDVVDYAMAESQVAGQACPDSGCLGLGAGRDAL
jgi:nucleotide-binding universal stress UspA family protein